jgi:hypothetical protein
MWGESPFFMPNYETHKQLHRRFKPLLIPTAFVLGTWFGGWAMGFVSILGYWIQPAFDQDLDHISKTGSEHFWERSVVLSPLAIISNLYARANALLPAVWYFPKGHRSFWSHFPPVGAFLRLFFFWTILWGIGNAIFVAFEADTRIVFYHDSIIALYFGLQLGDWVHSIADWSDDYKKKVGIFVHLRRSRARKTK